MPSPLISSGYYWVVVVVVGGGWAFLDFRCPLSSGVYDCE
jgi:hypothetical protein